MSTTPCGAFLTILSSVPGFLLEISRLSAEMNGASLTLVGGGLWAQLFPSGKGGRAGSAQVLNGTLNSHVFRPLPRQAREVLV
jgi:hypothetical protein